MTTLVRVCGIVLALTLLGSGGSFVGPAAASNPASAVAVAPNDRGVWIATYNVGDGSNAKKIADLKRLADKRASVIGIQEAGDREEALERFVSLKNYQHWRLYRPGGAGAASVPLLWNSRVWKVVNKRSVVAVPSRDVGPGAGPDRAKTKRVNILYLERKVSGIPYRVRVLNTHFISSQQNAGRARHARDHARALADLIGPNANPVPVAVTGDFNSEGEQAYFTPVRQRVKGWTGAVTHPKTKRAIDHVLSRKLSRPDRRVLDTSSDHHSVMVKLGRQ